MEVMLRTALAKLDKELRSHDAKVSYDKLPRVSGDPDRLIQVFENLLRNALQHRGEAPPSIRISAERQADGWLFALRDNGPGLEAAYLETIFRPFERLHGRQRPGPWTWSDSLPGNRGAAWGKDVGRVASGVGRHVLLYSPRD